MANNDLNRISKGDSITDPGPFRAKVISHQDSTYMGVLTVELLKESGNTGSSGQVRQVQYLSPFYGSTSVDYTKKDPDDYNSTQKSYGMWMVPPDPGTIVVVIFVNGDPKRGYWIGCELDENMNFMLPGIAATQNVVEGGGRLPVAEYNKKLNNTAGDTTKFKKPKHPLADVLMAQGLLKDDTRGITTSSARRETPSSVFGISTPGPVDKRSGAPRGAIGTSENKIPNAPVSRMGGSTFVMDDGDANFLRKSLASAGPPEYASIEQGDTSGLNTVPHNELVRIRTRTGHQILLHNSEDLIYIGNAKGTAWVELTSNGKIDIYCADSISVHSGNDINFTADRDINLTAGGNVNVVSGGNFDVNAAKGNTNIDSKYIYLNSGKSGALKASRVPQAEPWAGHENLNPAACTPSATKASKTLKAPGATLKYSTTTDTFNKVKGS
jgi:hypothetical protein